MDDHTFVSDFCQVYFRFVHEVEGRYIRALHPLDLDKAETPKIVEHAEQLKNRLQRLKTIPVHSEKVRLKRIVLQSSILPRILGFKSRRFSHLRRR